MNAVAADSTAASPTEIADGGVGGTGTSRWKWHGPAAMRSLTAVVNSVLPIV